MTTMANKITKPTMQKLPAVRLGVKELGGDAPIAQVRNWVKDKYGLEMTDLTAENYVYKARKEAKEANGTPAKMQLPKAAPAPIQAPTTPAAPKATGNGVPIEQVVGAVTTLKGLVGTLGKDNVQRLVEAL
jgi:hypothetical protein